MDKKHSYKETLHGTGYELDSSLRNEETKVSHCLTTHQVSVVYRGMALNKPNRWKQANHHFKGVSDKNGDGYSIDTTGHSLGGQLVKHVSDSHRGMRIATSRSVKVQVCCNLLT